MKIAIIAGETSGDQLGGWLMEAIKNYAHTEHQTFIGLGGERMQAQGLQSLFPMQEIALIGFTEVLPHYAAIRARINRMVEYIEIEKPDILITIDSAGFNFRVVNALRKRGHHRPKFIHYVAPTVWAYKPQRAKLIASLYDALMTLLPFEPPYFIAEGLPTHFVGHQIAWEWREKGDGTSFRVRHGITENTPLLALFPGSRNGELNRMLPIYESTIVQLQQHIPNLELLVQVPPHMLPRMQETLKNWPIKSHLLPSTAEKKDAFAAATAALAKSGTISLECALAGLPSITTYRANPITAAILRRILRTKFVNIANILSEKMIVPELLQEQCNPEDLSAALIPLLTDAHAREQQISALNHVANLLGANEAISPSDKAAGIVLRMVNPA
jgi:lipid-A-disaccharide synthase